MDREQVERWVQAWLDRHHPSSSPAASMDGCAAGREWAELDIIESLRETADGVVVRFTWSLHAETEFTVHEAEGDATLRGRETAEVRFGPDGSER